MCVCVCVFLTVVRIEIYSLIASSIFYPREPEPPVATVIEERVVGDSMHWETCVMVGKGRCL